MRRQSPLKESLRRERFGNQLSDGERIHGQLLSTSVVDPVLLHSLPRKENGLTKLPQLSCLACRLSSRSKLIILALQLVRDPLIPH